MTQKTETKQRKSIKPQIIQRGEQIGFQINDSGTTQYRMEKKTPILPQAYIRINSRCIIDLNVKVKTLKLLEENTGEKSLCPWVSKGFIDRTQKALMKKKY